MYILGCLFALLTIGFVLALSFVRGLFRFFFGAGRDTRDTASRRQTASSEREGRTTLHHGQSRTKKRIIEKDEGEYVDFEE